MDQVTNGVRRPQSKQELMVVQSTATRQNVINWVRVGSNARTARAVV